MQFFSLLIFIGGLVGGQSANCTTPPLANLTVQENFNLTRFLGVWFEIEWLPGAPHTEDELWRDFYQSFELVEGSTTRLSVSGKARVLNQATCFSFGPWQIIANNSAKMILERKSPNDTTFLNWPYHILKTDYENYALIYGCTSSNVSHAEPCPQPILWLFSRTVTLTGTHRSMLDTFIDETLCVNRTALEITPHSDKSCLRSFAASLRSFSPWLFVSTLIIDIYLRVH